MPELERQLTALGATIAYPPTPDLASKVRPRLAAREAPARRHRRPLALALAVLVLALAVAFAVPPARTALLRFFHIRGATAERVEVLPAAEPQTARDLGRPFGRAAAESRVGFRLVLPRGAQPDRVYVLEGAVATIPLRWHGKKLLLSEFRNDNALVLKKLVPDQTFVEPLQVGLDHGALDPGRPARAHLARPDRELPGEARSCEREHPALDARRADASPAGGVVEARRALDCEGAPLTGTRGRPAV